MIDFVSPSSALFPPWGAPAWWLPFHPPVNNQPCDLAKSIFCEELANQWEEDMVFLVDVVHEEVNH